MAVINEVGNVYGYLTVIERAENSKDGQARWKCKCKCGNETIVLGKHLRSGNTKSCGCLRKEKPGMRKNLTGQRFGRLLVLGEPQIGNKSGTIWKCLCDCGTICYKTSAHLVHGNTTSCGCYKKELHSTMNDLTGQKFGELTALYSIEIANDGQRVWHCKCSCGNETDVRAGALRGNRIKSCGCKTSKGNLYIRELLISKKIDFKQEYSFEDLYYKSQDFPLKFDFAIFKNDQLVMLIEYNGIQHYKPIDFFGGEQNFINQIERDNLKKEYCIKHNIPLKIIKYNENIEQKIGDFLNELYF